MAGTEFAGGEVVGDEPRRATAAERPRGGGRSWTGTVVVLVLIALVLWWVL
ncbi:MAG: hypothetical protein WD273_08515 [Trueperaceae bacterium]